MKKKLHLLIVALFVFSNFTFSQKRFAGEILSVSREYNPSPNQWSAVQILGEPNVYPDYGDFGAAWSPEFYGDQRDYIELGFNNSGPIDSIFIYETFAPGFVDTVYVKNPNTGQWVVVYSDSASAAPPASRILAIGFPTTAFNVSELRIAVASDLATNYVEIDAVAISPGTNISIQPDAAAGNKIKFDGLDDIYYTNVAVGRLFSDSAKSITAWIKVDSVGPAISLVDEGAGVITDGTQGYVGIFQGNLNGIDSLYFLNYSSGYYQIGIGYTLNEWMHLAYIHENDTLKAFKNGVLVSSIFSPATGDMTGIFTFGYNGYGDVYFNGEIDEVRTFSRALSAQEIREQMHLTPTGSEPDLTGFWQFNDFTDFQPLLNIKPAFEGNPASVFSTIPVGSGVSNSQTEANGNVAFTGTDLSLNYSAQSGSEVTVSRLDILPHNPVSGNVTPRYWILHQFSGTAFSGNYSFMIDEGVFNDPACYYTIYNRPFNSDATWTLVDTAASVNEAASIVTFNSLNDLQGQFLIKAEGVCSLSPPIADFTYTTHQTVADCRTLTVFNQSSTNATSITWTFGDNQTGAGDTVNHTYAQEGVYEVCIIASNQTGADTSCQNVSLICPGISDVPQLSMNVFPNPADKEIFISLENIFDGSNMHISMFDVQGKEILTEKIPATKNFMFNVEAFSKGIYLLKATNENSGKTALGRISIF